MLGKRPNVNKLRSLERYKKTYPLNIIFLCSNSDTEDGHQLESQARGVLLRAVKEEDAALRQIVLNFWLQGNG